MGLDLWPDVPRMPVITDAGLDVRMPLRPDMGPDLALASLTTGGITGLTFPSISVGSSTLAQTFTITNTGQQISGAIELALLSAPDFAIQSGVGDCVSSVTSLAAGATCTVHLVFVPIVSGVRAGTVSFSATPGGSGSIYLSGTALAAPTLSPSPSLVSFGSVPVNQISPSQTVIISNIGGSATRPLTVTFSGTGVAQVAISGSTCAAALPPGTTCSLAVRYSPTDTTGVNGTINVGDGSVSVSVPMTGTGLAPGELSLSPGSYGFGSVAVGLVGVPMSFTLSVPSTAMIDSGAIAILFSGPNAADFSLTSNTCPVSLNPGAYCTFGVTFAPSAVGARSATLNVTGGNGGTASSSIGGTGIPPVSLVALDASSSPVSSGLDFGQYPVSGDRTLTSPPTHSYRVVVRGSLGAGTTLSVVLTDSETPRNFDYALSQATNRCTGALLNVQSQTAAGGNASNWSYDAGLGGMFCDFSIEFYPQASKGNKTATITAQGSAGGLDSLTLIGTAVSPLSTPVNPVDFGKIVVGSQSSVMTRNVTNQGILVQGPIAVALSGSNASEFTVASDSCSGMTLVGGTTCTLGIVFQPLSSGTKSATLTASAGAETATLSLAGQGN
jgi:hypothetical protein